MKIIIIFWAICAQIVAQTLDINAMRIANPKFPLTDISQPIVNRESQAQIIHTMDQPIHKDKYLVGPGDQFQINILSSDDVFTYKLVVTPTGEILIPSVGVIQVYGLTLTETIKSLESMIQSWNQNARIHITLSQIREFKIKVIGHLQNPGLYSATPVSRVSDIFNTIQDETDEVDDDSDLAYPELSRRNIHILRDGDSLHVDLVKFGATGNDQFNPFVQQGDIIVIPLKQHVTSIFGGIKIPGEYEFVPNETLIELIQLAGDLRPDADPKKIEITRFTNFTDKFSFIVNYINSDTIIVEPEDHIMVRYEQDYKKQDIVFITGEVHYPGVYAIELGSTLGDIITKAGGYTKRANPSNIMVNNSSIRKIPDRELERILLIPEENRGQSERAYIKARALTIKGSIESNSMNQSKELMNFTLVNNDEIYVPENFNYIEILGGILKPGRYPFSNNRTFDEYIKLAGGKSRTATRDIFIIKSGTGQRLPANRDIIIENGDTIFIADKMEYNKWIILKDILTTLGSVATLIVVIQSVIGT